LNVRPFILHFMCTYKYKEIQEYKEKQSYECSYFLARISLRQTVRYNFLKIQIFYCSIQVYLKLSSWAKRVSISPSSR